MNLKGAANGRRLNDLGGFSLPRLKTASCQGYSSGGVQSYMRIGLLGPDLYLAICSFDREAVTKMI